MQMRILAIPGVLDHLARFLAWQDLYALLATNRFAYHLFDQNQTIRNVLLSRYVPGYSFLHSSHSKNEEDESVDISLVDLHFFNVSQLTPLHVYPTTALTTTSPRRLHRLARLALAHSRFVLLLQSLAHSSSDRPPTEPEPYFESTTSAPHSLRQLVFPSPLSSSSSSSSSSSASLLASSAQSRRSAPIRERKASTYRKSRPPPPLSDPKALKYYASSWRKSRWPTDLSVSSDDGSVFHQHRKASTVTVTSTSTSTPSLIQPSSPHDLLQATSRIRAPILRVFVPTSDLLHASTACQDQLVASGLWDHLSTGDIVCNLGYVPNPASNNPTGPAEHNPTWLLFNGTSLVIYTPAIHRLPVQDPISLPSPFYYDHILKQDCTTTTPQPNLRLVVEKEQFMAFNASFHPNLPPFPSHLHHHFSDNGAPPSSSSSSPIPSTTPSSKAASASASWVSLPDKIRSGSGHPSSSSTSFLAPSTLTPGAGTPPIWSLINYPHVVKSPTSPGGLAMVRKWAWTVRVWRGGWSSSSSQPIVAGGGPHLGSSHQAQPQQQFQQHFGPTASGFASALDLDSATAVGTTANGTGMIDPETFIMGIGWEGEWILEAEGTREGRAFLGECLGQLRKKGALREERNEREKEDEGEGEGEDGGGNRRDTSGGTLKMEWEVVREKSGGGKVWLRLLESSLRDEDLLLQPERESQNDFGIDELGFVSIPKPSTSSTSMMMAASISMSTMPPRASISSAPSSMLPRSSISSTPSMPRASVSSTPSMPRASVSSTPSMPRASVSSTSSMPRASVSSNPNTNIGSGSGNAYNSRPSTSHSTRTPTPLSRSSTPISGSGTTSGPPGMIRRPSITKTVGRRPSNSRKTTATTAGAGSGSGSVTGIGSGDMTIPVQAHPLLGLDVKIPTDLSLGLNEQQQLRQPQQMIPQASAPVPPPKTTVPTPTPAPVIPPKPISSSASSSSRRGDSGGSNAMAPSAPPQSPPQRKKLVKNLLHKSLSVKGGVNGVKAQQRQQAPVRAGA